MNIVIYSTETCGFCKMLKRYLDEKGIKYIEKFADKDEKIAMELYEKSKQFAVPFTEITKDNGDVEQIIGFDREKIEKVLNS